MHKNIVTQTEMQTSKDFAKLRDNLIIGYCKIKGVMFINTLCELNYRIFYHF